MSIIAEDLCPICHNSLGALPEDHGACVAQGRLNAIWRDHLAYGGPQRPVTDELVAEVRGCYAKLEAPESRVATATMFRSRGIEVGDHPPLASLRFQPDWDDDEEVHTFDGYTDGRTWNGWQVPYVERAVLEALAAVMGVGEAVWRMDGDVLRVNGYSEEEEVVEPVTCATVDGEKLLWKLDLGLCFIEPR